MLLLQSLRHIFLLTVVSSGFRSASVNVDQDQGRVMPFGLPSGERLDEVEILFVRPNYLPGPFFMVLGIPSADSNLYLGDESILDHFDSNILLKLK